MTNKLGLANQIEFKEDKLNELLVLLATKIARADILSKNLKGNIDSGRLMVIQSDIEKIRLKLKNDYYIDKNPKEEFNLPYTFKTIQQNEDGDWLVEIIGMKVIITGQQYLFIQHIKENYPKPLQFKAKDVFVKLNMRGKNCKIDMLFRHRENIKDMLFTYTKSTEGGERRGHWVCNIDSWL